MKKLLSVMLLIMLSVSGCGAREINTAAIPLGIGLDYQDQKYLFSAQIAHPSSPEQGSGEGPNFDVISSQGTTFSESARRTLLSFPNLPLWSHSNIIILGENLARQDMALFMDPITRSRLVRKSSYIVIAHQATPEEIFNIKPLLVPYTASAINNIMKTQETQLGIYSPITLIELSRQLADPGTEPVVPVVTIDKSEQPPIIKIEELAVFRSRKMVGSLSETESRGYRYLSPKMIQGGLFIIPSPTDEGKWITLELSRSQSKTEAKIEDSQIKIKIKITGEGNFYEQNGTGNMLSIQNISLLEKLANQEIEKQITMCIKKAQTLNSDIFGWGQLVQKTNPKLWKQIKPNWGQMFPDIQTDITVDFSIRRTYLTDKSFVFR